MTEVSLTHFLDQLPIICPVRLLSGYLCPGCGMTHALVELAQLHVKAAIAYNPFSPLLILCGLIWLLHPQRKSYTPSRPFLILLLSAFLFFGIFRNLA